MFDVAAFNGECKWLLMTAVILLGFCGERKRSCNGDFGVLLGDFMVILEVVYVTEAAGLADCSELIFVGLDTDLPTILGDE